MSTYVSHMHALFTQSMRFAKEHQLKETQPVVNWLFSYCDNCKTRLMYHVGSQLKCPFSPHTFDATLTPIAAHESVQKWPGLTALRKMGKKAKPLRRIPR